MCIGGGRTARPSACMRNASATASTYSPNGINAVRSWRDNTMREGGSLASMRKHLDERALRRAWTEHRLMGACVSQWFERIPTAIARQEVGCCYASSPAGARCNAVEQIAVHRFI